MTDKDIREVIQLLRNEVQNNPQILKNTRNNVVSSEELLRLQREEQSRQLEPVIYK